MSDTGARKSTTVAEPVADTIAAAELSLHRNVLAIREKHGLANLAPVHVRNRFTSIVRGEPFMLELSRDADPDVYGQLGKTLTVHELAYQMITTSSNLATNLLVELVGIETIQRALDEMDIDGVKVLRGVEDQAAFEAGLNNETTANGLVKLLRIIAEGHALSPETSSQMVDAFCLRAGFPPARLGQPPPHRPRNLQTGGDARVVPRRLPSRFRRP